MLPHAGRGWVVSRPRAGSTRPTMPLTLQATGLAHAPNLCPLELAFKLLTADQGRSVFALRMAGVEPRTIGTPGGALCQLCLLVVRLSYATQLWFAPRRSFLICHHCVVLAQCAYKVRRKSAIVNNHACDCFRRVMPWVQVCGGKSASAVCTCNQTGSGRACLRAAACSPAVRRAAGKHSHPPTNFSGLIYHPRLLSAFQTAYATQTHGLPLAQAYATKASFI
jgi:hypothetical protein